MTTTTQLVPGWNGGANTLAELEWDGYYTFQLGQRTGIAVGLSKTVCEGAWPQIEHAFMVQGDAVSIYEKGVKKYGPVVHVVEAKTFKIERSFGQVRYSLDNVLLYTSLINSSGKVWLDAALYAKDDTIIDAALVTVARLDRTTAPAFEVDPETGRLVDAEGDPIVAEEGESLSYSGSGFRFAGWAADDEAGDFGNAGFRLGGTGTSYDLATGDGRIRLFGYGADTSDATAQGRFGFSSAANDVQTPDTSYAFPFVRFYSNGEALTDLAGTGEGTFSVFGSGLETQIDWGWGQIRFESSGTLAATPPALVWAVLDWPLIGATAYTPIDPYVPFAPYDPETGEQTDPETGYVIDPETGYLIDPGTGYLIDPETGYLIDPGTGNLLDPTTGQPIFGTSGGASVLFDWPAFTGRATATVGDTNALFQWPAFEGEAHTGAKVTFDWPALEGEAVATNPGFATALFDWPAFEGEATALTGQVASATCNWPAFGGEAYSGAAARFDWPALAGESAATVGGIARTTFDWPAFTGEAAATVGGVASALFDWPVLGGEASALTGGAASALFNWPAFEGEAQTARTADALFDWPAFEGSSAVTVGGVASALFDWPGFAGESAVTTQSFASALFDWPAFAGEAGDGVHVVLDWPAFTGSATAAHAVVAADAEAYAINLATGAMTRLLLGPLDKLVTAHGKLYALRDGELLVLAGDADGLDGEGEPVAIPAAARFAQQNFGALNAKRCSEVYLDTRENDGVTLDLIQDESTAWRYQTATDNAPAMGTHKVSTGRGIKFHTLGVIVKNRNGGRLDIGGMELLIQPLSRRPKT
jgi:hypothetical protein